jgi:NAD-dependent DNA ligase
MTESFARQGAAYKNDLNRSLGALLGIAQGVLCDGLLNDQEIIFLNEWLTENDAISATWPGDLIHARIKSILDDGIISEDERNYLTDTLQELIGGTREQLAERNHVTELAFDENHEIVFENKVFCLTGKFVFAKRDVCEALIKSLGGNVSQNISSKVNYVVVGSLGSPEWKNGSFGDKIKEAANLRQSGLPIKILYESDWKMALSIHSS